MRILYRKWLLPNIWQKEEQELEVKIKMSEFVVMIRDLRRDFKSLIEVVTTLNNRIGTFEKTVASIDKLQKTLESSEPLLKELVKEMREGNGNIKTVLGVLKEMKGSE